MKLIILILVLCVPIMAQKETVVPIESDSEALYLTDANGKKLATFYFDKEIKMTLRRVSAITWGCAIRPATDKVEDFYTLDCREKDGGKAFVLDIPKNLWPAAWSLPGEREFYYGVIEDGRHVAIKTKATHCDTEFHRPFGGNRVQSQMCGKMFPE